VSEICNNLDFLDSQIWKESPLAFCVRNGKETFREGEAFHVAKLLIEVIEPFIYFIINLYDYRKELQLEKRRRVDYNL